MATKNLPSIQWYPGDWMKDAAVRSCSLAARGLWWEVLQYIHTAPRRGYLEQADGSPMAVAQVARLVGCDTEEARVALEELRAAGVFSETDRGVIFSRRMVREAELSEVRREVGSRGGRQTSQQRRQQNGQQNPQQTGEQREAAKGRQNTLSSSSSSSSSSKGREGYSGEGSGVRPALPRPAQPTPPLRTSLRDVAQPPDGVETADWQAACDAAGLIESSGPCDTHGSLARARAIVLEAEHWDDTPTMTSTELALEVIRWMISNQDTDDASARCLADLRRYEDGAYRGKGAQEGPNSRLEAARKRYQQEQTRTRLKVRVVRPGEDEHGRLVVV